MMRSALILALALCVSERGFAEDALAAAAGKKSDSNTSMKVEDAAGTKNKVPGDIDEEITNAKLRADSGSKSKFSISNSWTYTGGSISNAFGSERPNLSGQPGQQTVTSISTGLSARYRWTKHDSMTLGTSFGILTPFQGHIDKSNNQTTVYDPSLGYARVGKLGPIQSVTGIGYAYGTSVPALSVHVTHQFGAFYNGMYVFKNRFSTGISIGTNYNVYSTAAGSDPTDKAVYKPHYYGNDRRTLYDLSIYPLAEYKLNDRYSIRTVFGYLNWKHLYGDQNSTRLIQKYVYQSLGMAISVARDVYVYPYIQVVPSDLRSDFTNVALSASINMF